MNRRLLIGSCIVAITAACGGSTQKATETKPDAKQPASSNAAGSQAAGSTAGNAAGGASNQMAQGSQQAAQGLQQMMQGLQQMSKNTAKPVDSDELKTLIPDISGWTKGDVHGEMVSMGFASSNAKAKYTKGDSTLEVEITDSTANQLLLSPLMMVMSSGFEEKSDDGYKKAVQISGFPGFEEWEKGAKHAQATAVVNNRFIVQANAHDVDSTDAARKAVEAVNLTKLATLK
jgi:hypothetical protein